MCVQPTPQTGRDAHLGRRLMTCEIVADVKVANEALRVYAHFGETYPSTVAVSTYGSAVRTITSFTPDEAATLGKVLLAAAAKCGCTTEKMAERAVDLLRRIIALDEADGHPV